MRYLLLILLFISSGMQGQEVLNTIQTLEKQWIETALQSIQLRGELRGVNVHEIVHEIGLDSIVFKDQSEMPQPTNKSLIEVNAYAHGKRYSNKRVVWEEIRLSRILLNYEFRIFERILAHELGHVMGLHHCCEEEGSECVNKFICMEVMSIGQILDGDKHQGLYPSQFQEVYWDNYFELIKQKNSE